MRTHPEVKAYQILWLQKYISSTNDPDTKTGVTSRGQKHWSKQEYVVGTNQEIGI